MSGGAAPVAVLEEVGVERAGRRIVQSVSLALLPGTLTLLIGPNGAGKTTLIHALSGGLPVVAGRVRVAGHDPRTVRAARRAMGLVPQEIALYPRLTVRENLEVFGTFAGAVVTPALVAHCLDRTGLGAVTDALVATLSGGYQRRANIACALVTRPRLLLLDEPLVGLDPLARRAIGEGLRHLIGSDGVAVLLATHDLDEGEAIADTVAVLHSGRIAASGRPADLVGRVFPNDARRVEVSLVAAPDETARRGLQARGFAPDAGSTVWQGVSRAADPTALGAADLGLKPAQIREMRVRRLGLGDAYSALMAGAA